MRQIGPTHAVTTGLQEQLQPLAVTCVVFRKSPGSLNSVRSTGRALAHAHHQSEDAAPPRRNRGRPPGSTQAEPHTRAGLVKSKESTSPSPSSSRGAKQTQRLTVSRPSTSACGHPTRRTIMNLSATRFSAEQLYSPGTLRRAEKASTRGSPACRCGPTTIVHRQPSRQRQARQEPRNTGRQDRGQSRATGLPPTGSTRTSTSSISSCRIVRGPVREQRLRRQKTPRQPGPNGMARIPVGPHLPHAAENKCRSSRQARQQARLPAPTTGDALARITPTTRSP